MTTLTDQPTGLRAYAVRNPVTTYLLVVLGLGLPLLAGATLLALEQDPFLLLLTYVGLTGTALVLTRWTQGPGSVKALLGRLLRWRFGVSRWLTIVLALPLLTLGVATVSGTLQAPERGWAYELGVYLFLVFIFGGLILNLWEELGWMGFVQSRLTERRGLLRGALLTAVPFAVLHLPRAFVGDWSWSTVPVTIGAVIVLAPFLRYLLGLLYVDTAGSLLAVGLMHAAFNASGSLGAVGGGWQNIPALIALTAAMALLRRSRRLSVPAA